MTRALMKEQTAFEAAQWEAKKARLRRVARDEPDMPLCLLAERFGLSEQSVTRILADEGIRRERDFIADYINGRRHSA